MKWLGQHIVDFIARFRSDVYLEDLTTDTSTSVLVVDANDKVCKNTSVGGDITSVGLGTDGVGLIAASGDVDWDILGGNAISTAGSGGDTITINHDDTSSASSINASGRTFLQDITLDTYGHVTAVSSGDPTFAPLLLHEDYSFNPASLGTSGAMFNIQNSRIIDAFTSASGTVSAFNTVNLQTMTLRATNASVTTTNATTLYIEGPPIADENQTITNPYALWVDSGLVKFDGALTVGGTITGDVTGDVTGNADTVTITDKADDVDYDVVFGNSVSALYDDTGTLTYNPNDAALTSTNFVGALTGNASGSSASCTGNAATSTKIASITNTDIVVLAGAQTLTGTKTLNSFKGTGATTVTNILDEDAMDTDSNTALATQQSIKAYADRPAKQIQVYHANWKGASTTTLTYLPLAGVPDEATGSGTSTGMKESNAIIMPAAGRVKEIILRMNWATITTSDDITWTVLNRASNKKMTAFSAIDSFTMVNPTQGGTDANNTRTSGDLGTDYPFAEYDALAITMQWASTGPAASTDRIYVTVVIEYDYTGIGY